MNQWLETSRRALERVRPLLIEYEFRPEYQDIPLRLIQWLLNGFENEVRKLQSEVDLLKRQQQEAQGNKQ